MTLPHTFAWRKPLGPGVHYVFGTHTPQLKNKDPMISKEGHRKMLKFLRHKSYRDVNVTEKFCLETNAKFFS